MRGAPQVEFDRAISRMRRRISERTLGWPLRDFHRQKSRKARRCHLMTVSG